MVPDVPIVVSEHQDLSTRELASTLAHELSRQGVRAYSHVGRLPAPRPDRVPVLLDPSSYLATEGGVAPPRPDVLRRTVFVCPGPAPSGVAEGDEEIALLSRAGAVFALDRRDVTRLHRAGVQARLMRPGYSTSLDHYDPNARRDIDIMVLGARTPRRASLLAQAAPVLARHNCLISLWEPGVHTHPGPGYPGDGRWPLLARAKVLINLHGEADARLEWSRVLDAIHAGAVVVTEQASGLAPLDAGRHLLVASAAAVPFVADQLLRDPERLVRLRSEAYERLSTWIPYALPVSVLRAAIVELVGEPLAEEPASGSSPAGEEPAQSPEPVPVTRLASVEASPPTVRRAARVVAVADSPAWAAHPAPRLSAVCVARDEGARHLAETLDSIATARLRELELVVVHPVGGPAEQAAVAWCAAHPRCSSRRIAVRGPAELGPARRAGSLVARAPFVLLIEPGQTLYPRAPDVLTGTLDGIPGAAVAYPLLVTGRDGEATLANTAGKPALAPLVVRAGALPGVTGDDGVSIGLRYGETTLVPQILARRVDPLSSPEPA